MKHKIMPVNTLPILNVSKKNLVQAIIYRWASMFSDRVTHYSENRHKMAVVIKYVVSKWSGVVYTINPQWIFSKRILLNPFQTLEKSRFFCSHSRLFGYSTSETPSLSISESGTKIRASIKSRNDASHSPLPEKWPFSCHKQTLRCEGKIGSPQDLEWVIDSDNKIYFLQTRPISAISNSNTGTIWTRNFIGERWMVPATQLGWEEVQRQIEYLIAYPETSSVTWEENKATTACLKALPI